MFVPANAYRRCGILLSGLLAFWPAHVWLAAQERAQERGSVSGPAVVVLGIAQDGGYPQLGCRRACCERAWSDPTAPRDVVSLGVVDPSTGERWLFECTPDIRRQLHALDQAQPANEAPGLRGVFLTHAHIGHYSGLLQFGREVLGAQQVPVHVMPRFAEFLRSEAPWSQLVQLKNVELAPLVADRTLKLNEHLTVTPVLVPHRDEFSETVAFRIEGPHRKVLFLPDIDKWERWERTIEKELAVVDIAYLDATFFDGSELPGRDMREIPHPFVVESLQRFARLSPEERAKIRLIHFNHTNPLLDPKSAATRQVQSAGLRIAEQGERVEL
ncbi:MAG: MBL fold metallo-hydrolase [Planctomycetota bacterium]|jgi:pyrroloquinoline quinone biosynthesis protein B